MFAISMLIWVSVVALPWFGYRRGSGTVFLTIIGIGCAGLLAYLTAPSLANLIPLTSHANVQANQGMWSLIVFLVFSIGAFPLGIFLNRFSHWSFDPFDTVIGSIFGMGGGLLVAWMLAMMLVHAVDGTPAETQVSQLFVIRQFGYYDWWHQMMGWFHEHMLHFN